MKIHVDATNPGHFFACCGLLELADRLWGEAEGWFSSGAFHLEAPGVLPDLMHSIATTPLTQVDVEDATSSPVFVQAPFHLLLDWWNDERAGGRRLKGWAGRMNGFRIARAMQAALAGHDAEDLLNHGMVVYDCDDPSQKVEPFYFDARRGAQAHPIDIGFSPDALAMTNTAYPAVEFLCLVGLQRSRPLPTDRPRTFDYFTWSAPIEARLVPAAACGLLERVHAHGYRFEAAFRTDQRKHKAFTPATPHGGNQP